MVSHPGFQLLFDVFLLSETCITLQNLTLQADCQCLVFVKSDLQFVQFEFICISLLFELNRQLLDLTIFFDAQLLHTP